MAVQFETVRGRRSFDTAGWRSAPQKSAGLQTRIPWLAPAALALFASAVLATLCVEQLAFGSPLRCAGLAPIGFMGLGALAFAALRAGIALSTRLDVLSRALDAVPDGWAVVAPDGQVVHANVAFERLLLSAADEPPLERISRVFATDSNAARAFRRLYGEVAVGALARTATIVSESGIGVVERLRPSAAPLAGRPGYCLWSLRSTIARDEPGAIDDGARGEFEEDRGPSSTPTLSREPFQRLFANAPVGIAVVDRFGRFVEANRAAGELFGASPQELIGGELIGLLNEGERAAIAARLAAAADGEVDREPIEIRLERTREKTIVLLLSRFYNQEDESPPVGTVGRDAALPGAAPIKAGAEGALMLYLIDVTEQKNLEAQFAQSQKMQAVGQLAGGVAHDFNNLLTAMIGFCDLLLLRSRPGDPAFADIMQIKQNANRAANLVRQLLAFSRQQTLQPRILDITDILIELSHLLRRLIGEDIEFDVVHGRDLGLVKVDQGQLEQVVINLAVNARDAMPNGGRLTIRTADIRQVQPLRRGHEVMPAGDYVLIEVADTGVGISPDNLARIFEPFFSTKEVGSGTGLGLSTVYGIVKQTGGFVFVDSTPGRGTAFNIFLPRHEAGEAQSAGRADPAESAGFKDLTGSGSVILVEDDDAVRMFGARALRNKGYRVIEAKSGETALDLIRDAAEKIDLLITDVVMPQMDGPALIREVRRINPDIKVIFISGYTEDTFRQRLDSDSEIHFLAKPFSLKQLAIKVKDVINEKIAPSCSF
jgi:two-component system, cell cycle sensor histidine kinase and response regulator CckA